MIRLATAIALFAAASGCVASSDEHAQPTPANGKYGSGVPSDDGSIALGPPGGEGPTVDIPGSASGPQGSGTTASGVTIDDHGPLGRNTRLYLSREVPRLVVEIDAVRGFEPTNLALDELSEKLESVVDKPDGVDILQVETFQENRAPWTESELLDVEKRNRDHYSSKNVMILYVLYVNGAFADDSEALGLAYDSSSYAVFSERIRESAATPLVPAEAIEQAVVVHEMGHVLALVNIGYSSPRDHEDANHPNHSNNPNSVMYWAIDNVGVANLLGGRPSPPTNFDDDDRADLADLKSGRLRVA